MNSNITAAKVRGEFAIKIRPLYAEKMLKLRPGQRQGDPPHVQSDKNIEGTPSDWFMGPRGEKSSPEAEAEKPDRCTDDLGAEQELAVLKFFSRQTGFFAQNEIILIKISILSISRGD
ncbi:MAG: hypothetical protein IMY82_09890 [Chloroflexi bacterium]|nr:hypothetical protein [Chloroflexota bacterium]